MTTDRYTKQWNLVVQVLEGKDAIAREFLMESFRDAAHRSLLVSQNPEECRATLDCTQEIIRTGQVPPSR
jgi:hypothetical protein